MLDWVLKTPLVCFLFYGKYFRLKLITLIGKLSQLLKIAVLSLRTLKNVTFFKGKSGIKIFQKKRK